MKVAVKLLVVTLLMSMFTSFMAFAYNEGRALISDRENYDNERMYCYIYEDGHFAKNEWKFVVEDWYYFGEDRASKQNTWAEINSKWYYFDNFSRMLHDTTTPDGYTVGSDGAWVQN